MLKLSNTAMSDKNIEHWLGKDVRSGRHLFKAPLRHFPGVTEKYHSVIHQDPPLELSFEPWTSRNRSRNLSY